VINAIIPALEKINIGAPALRLFVPGPQSAMAWEPAKISGREGRRHGFQPFSRDRGFAAAHARFRRRARAAARIRPGEFFRPRKHPARAARAGPRQGAQGRAVGAAVAQGIRRHGFADRRLGGDVRGSRALAVRTAGAQLHGARRRQHERAEKTRHAGAEGQVAETYRARQGALVVRHDRARARRRLRA